MARGGRSSSRTNSAQLYRAVDVDQVQRKIERLVRSANEPLRKVLGKALLDEEEPRTVLCEVVLLQLLVFQTSPFQLLTGQMYVDLPAVKDQNPDWNRQGAVPLGGGADGATVTRV
ncbi:hypothetical protein T03_13657 [Trichinella britovi]|uniref:Uncharacterized protein n=1 Tax=Trichinella britovi TaxID=45882 RepID=A0A0V1D0G4_TRIBR|nr:hypothetical protein T03_13657 [Trichinella britovi]